MKKRGRISRWQEQSSNPGVGPRVTAQVTPAEAGAGTRPGSACGLCTGARIPVPQDMATGWCRSALLGAPPDAVMTPALSQGLSPLGSFHHHFPLLTVDSIYTTACTFLREGFNGPAHLCVAMFPGTVSHIAHTLLTCCWQGDGVVQSLRLLQQRVEWDHIPWMRQGLHWKCLLFPRHHSHV